MKTILALCLASAVFVFGMIHRYETAKRAEWKASSEEFRKRSAETSTRLSHLGDPEPGQAPPGYHPEAMSRLVTCKICAGKVSSDAKACPHCGDPRSQN
jgi:hypothetical protein